MKKGIKQAITAVVSAALVITLPHIWNISGSSSEAKSADDKKPLTKIISWSDYQYESTTAYDKFPELEDQLHRILDGAEDAGFNDPDYLLFGGDFTTADNGGDQASALERGNQGYDSMMSVVDDRFPHLNDDTKILLQGNHDMAAVKNLDPTGPIETEHFIVYMLNEDDFPTKQGSDSVKPIVQETADDLQNYLEDCVKRKETRPVFIASHTGLHYDIDRMDGNNQFAYVMFDAINEAAKELDVIFLFGHNHTNGDEQVGGSITYFEKGEDLAVCHEDSIANRHGTDTLLNFVYMNYGYVGVVGNITNNPALPGHEPTKLLVVTKIAIYEDMITLDRYSENGLEEAYSVAFAREHAPEPTKAPTEEVTATDNPQADNPTSVPLKATPVPSGKDNAKAPVIKLKGKSAVKKGGKVVIRVKINNKNGSKVKWSLDKKGKKLFKLKKKQQTQVTVIAGKKKGSGTLILKYGNKKVKKKIRIM